MLAPHVSLLSNRRCFAGGRKSNEDTLKERRRVSGLFSMMEPSLLQFYVSRQWLNKFKTFAEPGPISNSDFLCSHGGAYDTFQYSGRRKSFFFFPDSCLVPLPPNSSFHPRCRASQYSLRSAAAAAALQREVFYSSLCRRSSSPFAAEKGEELKSGRASHAPLFSSLSWQRAAEMMDLERTQRKYRILVRSSPL